MDKDAQIFLVNSYDECHCGAGIIIIKDVDYATAKSIARHWNRRYYRTGKSSIVYLVTDGPTGENLTP